LNPTPRPEAGRLLVEGLRCLGLAREALPVLKQGDPRKAALAVRIRTLTAVPNAWLAEQLHFGTRSPREPLRPNRPAGTAETTGEIR